MQKELLTKIREHKTKAEDSIAGISQPQK